MQYFKLKLLTGNLLREIQLCTSEGTRYRRHHSQYDRKRCVRQRGFEYNRLST